ncbi:DNA alkylation repair protein, partial [bacterium]
MDNENTYEDIHGELLTYRDENRAAKSKKFFQAEKGGYGEGDKFLGIQVPVLRKVARKYKRISLDEAEKLLQSEYHEERLLAVFILADIFKKSDGETQEKIFNLY